MTFFYHECSQKYGTVVKVFFGVTPWVVVTDPVALRKIAYKSVVRPEDTTRVMHMLVDEPAVIDEEMLLFAGASTWKAARRAFESSIMHPDKLALHLPAMRRCINRFLSYLKPYAVSGQAVDMKKEFGIVTMAITGEVAYGVTIWPEESRNDQEPGSKDEASELLVALHDSFECMEVDSATGYLFFQLMLPSLWSFWRWLAKTLPDAPQRRHMSAREKIAAISRRLMKAWQDEKAAATANNGHATCHANGSAKPSAATAPSVGTSSFLANMMEERLKQRSGGTADMSGLTDMQVIAQCLMLMIAGYDTSATTLATVMFCLGTRPDVQDKLRAELAAHPGCEDDVELLGKLPYMDAVVKEAQRLYPAAPIVARSTTSKVDLGNGITLPKGTRVAGNLYTIQRDAKQWPRAEEYLPERFLPETNGALGPADPNAFIPFGIGPRMCVGYKLANMTVRATLAAIILRYRVELHPSQKLPLRFRTGITMNPRDGVWVTLSEVK